MKRILPKFALAIVLLMACFWTSMSQNVTVTLDPSSKLDIVRYRTTDGGVDFTTSVQHSIGRHDGTNGINSGSQEDIYREQLRFDLSGIPSDAQIVRAAIRGNFLNYSNGSLQARISASSGAGINQIWQNIASGTEYFTGIQYNTANLNLTTTAFTNAVVTAIQQDHIELGVKSLSESSNLTYASTNFRLEIEYTPRIQVTVRNSFGGGTVIVDGGSSASGTVFNWLSGSGHTLQATNQPPNYFSTWYNVTTSSTLAGNPITVQPTSNTIYQANFSTVYNVTVHQYLANGQSEVGTLGRWNGASFGLRLSAPQTYSFSAPSTETLHGDSIIYSNQKHRIWKKGVDEEPNVLNHHEFSVGTGFPSSLTSQFTDSKSDITMKADLLEAPGTNGGDIQFRDPWYIDYKDPAYGNAPRNRGQNDAVLYTRSVGSTGFKPDYATQFDGGRIYRGVFLNQGSPNWAPPFYTVCAPNPNTINGWVSYFVNWTGSSVQFQDANSAQTAVVFQLSGATATARYKAHLGSSVSNTTGPNNQRKICFVADKYHLVYESSGEIYYCRSTDNGSTWSQDLRISDGSGLNRTPSLAVNRKQTPQLLGVTWEKFDASGSHSIICVNRYDFSAGTWSGVEYLPDEAYDIAQGFAGATPVMTMEPSVETIIWAVNSTGGIYQSGLHMWINNIEATTTSSVVIGSTDGNSLWPSSAEDPYTNVNGHIGLLWAQSGAIKYLPVIYDARREQLSYGSLETVSSGSALTLHDKPSFTYEWVGSTNRPVAAWQAYDQTYTYMTVILQRRRESGGWGTITQYTKDDDLYSPSIVPYDGSANLSMSFYENSTNGTIYLAKYTGSWGSRLTVSSSGRYPALGYDADGTATHFRLMYGAGNGAPYSIGTTNQNLPKSEGSDNEMLMRRITANNGSTAYDLTLRGLKLNQGRSLHAVSPDELPDSLLVSSAADAGKFLSTKPFLVPPSATFTVDISSVALNRKPGSPVSQGSLITRLEVLDATNNSVLSSFSFDTLSAGKMDPGSLSCTFNLAPLAGRLIRAKLVPVVNSDSAVQWTASVIHYDTSGNNSGLVKEPSGPAVSDVPTAFALQPSYPNPFNPTTTIGYQLPTDGFVKLVVYDILGRQIAELASGLHVAGRYSATWNASSVASGVYFARLTVTNELGQMKFNKINKLVLAK